MAPRLPELERLVAVMARLRRECPWDAQQTHRSLVQYLIEETAETVEAIETGDHDHLREELGDLLLQVIFHAEIATAEEPGFDVEDVARGIADKLIARHPYVFAATEVPTDLYATWEQRKAAEKGRTSVLQGIPEQLSALSRATKIISRSRSARRAGRAARRAGDGRRGGGRAAQPGRPGPGLRDRPRPGAPRRGPRVGAPGGRGRVRGSLTRTRDQPAGVKRWAIRMWLPNGSRKPKSMP